MTQQIDEPKTYTCPASLTPCNNALVCRVAGLCTRLHVAPIDLMGMDYAPMVHFVGFRGEEYHSAVRAFGLPDFVHRGWDTRAQREIAACDMVVFARAKDWAHVDSPSPYSYDDSSQADDPAAKERL